MKTIERRDAFELDGERFWREVFFARRFQERMYLEALGCESVDFLAEQGDPASGVTRRLKFVQKIDAPGPVRKIFGDTTSMIEDGRFDAARGRWTFRMIPERMADKIDITGETWLEPAGAARVERVCQLAVAVRIFAVGGLVESFIASSTEQSWAKQAAFMRRFVDDLKR